MLSTILTIKGNYLLPTLYSNDFTSFKQEENLTEKICIILHRKKQTNY